jgi:hypothetical protein
VIESKEWSVAVRVTRDECLGATSHDDGRSQHGGKHKRDGILRIDTRTTGRVSRVKKGLKQRGETQRRLTCAAVRGAALNSIEVEPSVGLVVAVED